MGMIMLKILLIIMSTRTRLIFEHFEFGDHRRFCIFYHSILILSMLLGGRKFEVCIILYKYRLATLLRQLLTSSCLAACSAKNSRNSVPSKKAAAENCAEWTAPTAKKVKGSGSPIDHIDRCQTKERDCVITAS